MSAPEFSRLVDVTKLEEKARKIAANEAERAALAQRFDLVSIGRLEAEVGFEPDGKAVIGKGRIMAEYVQACAVSGEDLTVSLDQPVALRFVPESGLAVAAAGPDEEIELDPEEPDEMPVEGTMIDLGEAIAQTLALAIDPYLTGPEADRVRKEKGLLDAAAAGPFAALAALRKD